MNKNIKIAIGALIILILVISGYVIKEKQNKEGFATIKIGVLSVLSGDGAAWGESAKRGIDLAFEEWRLNHPRKNIEIIYEDTRGEAKEAVTAYQKLINVDRVDVILGPLLQTELTAVAPLIAKNDTPVITPSYVPIENRLNTRNPLLIWMDVPTEAERMADYVYSEGVRSVAAIGTKDSWEAEVTNKFSDKFQSLGGKVLYKELSQIDAVDMRLTVTRALDKKPDALFIGTYYQFVNTTKAVRDLGYKGKVFSIEVDSYLASQTKGKSDGIQFIAPDFYVSDFADKFQKKYGEKPGIPAGQAYDAANLLLSFLERGSSKADILEAMREISKYNGVSGSIEFTKDNKTLLPTAIFELQNGEVRKIK